MEPTEHNLRAWEAAHRGRKRSHRAVLSEPVLAYLTGISGKHVLELACGFGDATSELVERGALVTAVDVAGTDLEVVRERAPTAALVHVDLQELPAELRRGRFDFVFAGPGSLVEVTELSGFAAGIVAALRPGGTLVLNALHPVRARLDAFLHWRGDYFAGPTVGGVVAALLEAGLELRVLEELPAQQITRPAQSRPPEEILIVAAKPA